MNGEEIQPLAMYAPIYRNQILPVPFTRHLSSPSLRLVVPTCRATRDDSSAAGEDGSSSSSSTPTEMVEIRFRRGSRRRRQQQRQQETNAGEQLPKKDVPPKSWEEMTLTEKALELYVGEKGALYWLNKFAYASIYIIIGAWILFRFVGPALNLYQLDAPPLAPDTIFKGSS